MATRDRLIEAMIARALENSRANPPEAVGAAGVPPPRPPMLPGIDQGVPMSGRPLADVLAGIPAADMTAGGGTADLESLMRPLGGAGAMPQSATEAEDLSRSAEMVGRGAMSAALSVPVGRGVVAGGRLLSAMARRPLAVAGGAGTALAAASPGRTDEPSPLDAARTKIGKLENNAQRFAPKNLDRSNRDAVRAAQEFLQSQGLYLRDDRGRPVTPDGVWGRGMSKAVEEYLQRNSTALGEARKDRDRLQADEASRATRAGPLRQIAREVGPWAATALGLYLGHRSRRGAVAGANVQTAERNRLADAMLTPGPLPGGRSAAARAEPARRAANVSDFWRMGGAGERVPFRPAQTERGFTGRPNAAEASTLFPPESTRFRGRDYGVIGAGLGEAGISGGGWYLAQQELAAAQAAVDREGSEANRARLERAHDMVALAQAALRGGLGYAGGRLGGAFTHPYSNARPNVAGAEGERMLLDQLLARRTRRRK